MDLVFFGSGAFGTPTLSALCSAHRVIAIVTQPDKPAGRGGQLTPTPIAQWANEHVPEVRLFKPLKVNVPEVVAELRGLGAQAWVVIAFGQKLGTGLLEGVFAINLHASLLPRWRGAAPINAAILAGDTESGNSVITLADRMDAGEVLGQSHRAIDPLTTAGELHDALAADGPRLVLEVLSSYERGTVTRRPQDESLVTLASKLCKEDGWLDFSAPAEECRRRVHGLTPWPGVTVLLSEDGTAQGTPLKVQCVKVEPRGSQELPGRLVDARAGLVACGAGTMLRLLEVQPPGKRSMEWGEFARGRRLGAGARLIGRSQG